MGQLEKSGLVYGWGALCSLGNGVVNNDGYITALSDGAAFEPRMIKISEPTTRVKKVFACTSASFVITDEGLFSYGHNQLGRLGLETSHNKFIWQPSKVELPPIKSLASVSASFAIDTSGRLWSWGENDWGQLGRTTQGSYDSTPRLVENLCNYEIKQVSCGDKLACCLTINGEVFIWGGDGPIDGPKQNLPWDRLPTKLNIERISQVACGFKHVLFLSADKKTVWGLGNDYNGQLRHAIGHWTDTPIKVPISGDKVIVKLECFGSDSAILTEDGEVTVWGPSYQESPRVINIKQVVDMSMGYCYMLALTSENRLYAFGDNGCGHFDQDYGPFYIHDPVEVEGLEKVRIKQISAGLSHCLIKCAKTEEWHLQDDFMVKISKNFLRYRQPLKGERRATCFFS